MHLFCFLIFSYLYALSTVYSIDNNPKDNNLFILIGEKIFLANLYDNPIRNELLSILPIKSVPYEKNNFRYFPLSTEIEEENMNNEASDIIQAYSGDILLYKRKELIIMNTKKFIENKEGEYIKIGHIDNAEEIYKLIEHYKLAYLWNQYNLMNYNEKIKPHEHYRRIMYFLTWKILTIICFLFL